MASSFWPILLPLLTTGLTQLIKLLVDLAKTGRLEIRDLFKWGGFPSSHSALVTCLAVVVGLLDGWYSAAFAIALAFAIIVIRDAMGLRMFVQRNSHAINQIRETLPANMKRKVAERGMDRGAAPANT